MSISVPSLYSGQRWHVDTQATYNASCSTPMPTRRPAIAPTAMLGMNNPAGTCDHTTLWWLDTAAIIQQQLMYYRHSVHRYNECKHLPIDMKGNNIFDVQCVSQKIPPRVFWKFFTNGWEFLLNFLHTYYAIISTLDYKFLFKYLQLWQSYAILSATT